MDPKIHVRKTWPKILKTRNKACSVWWASKSLKCVSKISSDTETNPKRNSEFCDFQSNLFPSDIKWAIKFCFPWKNKLCLSEFHFLWLFMYDLLFATYYRVETENHCWTTSSLGVAARRTIIILFNCDVSKNRGRLTATDQKQCFIISGKWRNYFLDYIARNHEQQIHQGIYDSGSNNVMHVFCSSCHSTEHRQTFEYWSLLQSVKTFIFFVVNFIFSPIIKLSFVELSKLFDIDQESKEVSLDLLYRKKFLLDNSTHIWGFGKL